MAPHPLQETKHRLKVELNILGMLIKYQDDSQEGQEYSVMWKVGNEVFETAIASIASQATKGLDQFQNVPYWVIECNHTEF